MLLARFGAVAVGTIGALAVAMAPASAYTETFVGKGEVQQGFDLNNQAMQLVHEQVTFVYELSASVSFDCEWWTGPDHQRMHHEVTVSDSVEVDAAVTAKSRKTGQWTGWTIEGLPAVEVGDLTVTDADCGAEGNGMKSVVDGSVESGDVVGGLYAVLDGERVLLTPDA